MTKKSLQTAESFIECVLNFDFLAQHQHQDGNSHYKLDTLAKGERVFNVLKRFATVHPLELDMTSTKSVKHDSTSSIVFDISCHEST